MNIDLAGILKGLGKSAADRVKTNIGDAIAQLSAKDLQIIERAGERKVELLVAAALGQDVKEDEKEIDATLGFLESKAAAIAKATLANTVLEVVKDAGKVVLKIAFGAIGL